MEYTTLSNGVKAPLLGLGTFQLSLADTENAVYEGIRSGEQYWNDVQRKERMQARNLGDTAAAALKAAAKGESVEEAVKEGIETANAIEEGKVKQGFFGKLFKK